ncbi:MAG: hypothetical protein NT099_04240 [Candidatus Saganbacteria bacterium]|nr:hypothetical protein [Candidatus Saganbacteria bacterium]
MLKCVFCGKELPVYGKELPDRTMTCPHCGKSVYLGLGIVFLLFATIIAFITGVIGMAIVLLLILVLMIITVVVKPKDKMVGLILAIKGIWLMLRKQSLGSCKKCGKEFSFIEFIADRVLCKKCNEQLLVELAQAEETIKTTKCITEEQIATLKKLSKNALLKLYKHVYSDFESDKELESCELATLNKMQEAFDLTNEEADLDNKIKPYIYINSIRDKNCLPVADVKIEYGGQLILKKDEVIHFADNAVLKEIKAISLGYRGGSQGISIPIAKGIRYRVGVSRGNFVKENRLLQTSSGALIVTNQRLFLQPYPGCKPASIPLNKILSHCCFGNGIEVFIEGREKSYFFEIHKTGSIEIFEMCLNYLLGQVE